MSNIYEGKSWQEIFAKEIGLINKTEDKLILNAVLDHVQEYHKKAPASSSGKYHPFCSLGDGGLIRHTKFVVQNALELIRATPEIENESDEIITAAILHDLVKYPGGEGTYTAADHPTLMAKLILDTCPSSEIAKTISRLVGAHQGKWNTDRKGNIINAKPEKQDEYVLHYADLLASRTYISPDFDENGEIIMDSCHNRTEIISESRKTRH